MRIFIVRHGESEGNVNEKIYQQIVDPNVPLSEFGHKQALACGEFLAAQFSDSKPRIYYSPFVRTQQTKDGIVQGLGGAEHFNKIYENPFLVEQSFGVFSLVTDDAGREKLFPEGYKYFKMLMDGQQRYLAEAIMGDSRLDVLLRVDSVINSIMRDVAEGVEDFIVVTHGVTSRVFEMRFMHHSVQWLEKSRNPGNCDVVMIEGNAREGYKSSKVYQGLKASKVEAAAVVEAEAPKPLITTGAPMDIQPMIIKGDVAKELWLSKFPWPTPDGHKYTRGHLVVVGGPLGTSGAAKLAGTSGLRTAAGLVTILAPTEEDKKVYVASSNVNAPMWGTYDRLDEMLKDKRVNSLIVGPGFGQGKRQDEILDAIAASGKTVLMDADALHKPRKNPNAIITPHEGEFARMFPDIKGTREEMALRAAQMTGSVVLLKGKETVIAAPDGRVAINNVATPWLGTAGSGDTLSGIIGGMMAAGMPLFEAAVAGAYIHGRAGQLAGMGIIADDVGNKIPEVLEELSKERFKPHAVASAGELKTVRGSLIERASEHLL